MKVRFVIQPGGKPLDEEMSEVPRRGDFVDLGDGINRWARSVRWHLSPAVEVDASVELVMGHPPHLHKKARS